MLSTVYLPKCWVDLSSNLRATIDIGTYFKITKVDDHPCTLGLKLKWGLLWHLSAQVLCWLEFRLEWDRQLFCTQIKRNLPWVGTQWNSSQLSTWADNCHLKENLVSKHYMIKIMKRKGVGKNYWFWDDVVYGRTLGRNCKEFGQVEQTTSLWFFWQL